MKQSWSLEEVKILQENYEWNPSVHSLLPERTNQAIRFKAMTLGLKAKGRGRIPAIDATYFDRWTPKMAWVIGFFAADGNLFHKLYNDQRENWYITFTQKDKETLQMIAEEIGYPSELIKQVWSKEYETFVHHFTFTNRYMFQRLETLGFMPNKSLKMQKINVPKLFWADFLRGYFDGDGCFSWSATPRQRTPRVSFTSGSRNFLAWIEARNTRYFQIPGGRLRQRRDTPTWSLVYRKSTSLTIMEHLYQHKNESLYLQRKYANYTDYLNYHGIDLSTYETPKLDSKIKYDIVQEF